MRVMQPRRQAAIWANDDAAPAAVPGRAPAAPAEAAGPGGALPLPPRRGRRAAQWASVTAAAAGQRAGEQTDDEEEDGEEPREPGAAGDDASDSSGSEAAGAAGGGRGGTADDAAVSDMDYLRSRVTAGFGAVEPDADELEPAAGADDRPAAGADSDEEEEEGEGGSGADDPDSADGAAERRASHARAGARGGGGAGGGGGGAQVVVAGGEDEAEAPALGETARLFVRNLPFAATEADLAEAFGEHGELEEVHLVLDRRAREGLQGCENGCGRRGVWRARRAGGGAPGSGQACPQGCARVYKGVQGCARVQELHSGRSAVCTVPDRPRAAQSCPRRRAAEQTLGMVLLRCEYVAPLHTYLLVWSGPGVKRAEDYSASSAAPAVPRARSAPATAPPPRVRASLPQGDAQVARHRAGAVCGGGGRRGGGRRAGRRHLPGPAAARAARARAARQGRRAGALALTQAARRPVPLRVGAPAGHAGAGLRVAGAHDCPAVFAPRACAAKAR